MGRWSQRQRRSTAAAPVAPPPSLNVVLVQVLDSSHCIIQFDGDPQVNGAAADASFLVNGGGMATATDNGGGSVLMDAGLSGPTMSAGDPWDMVSQPAWANAAIAFPQSGITF